MTIETMPPPRRGFVSRIFRGTGVGIRQFDLFLIVEVLCLVALIVANISQKSSRESASPSLSKVPGSSALAPASANVPALAPPAPPLPATPNRSGLRPESATRPSPEASGNRPVALAPTPLVQPGDQSSRTVSPGVNGVWKGHYQCAQGETALMLTVSGQSKALEARFRFETRGGLVGEFRMTGVYSETERTLLLRPSNWINRPGGFDAVPISANIDPQFREIAGRIDYPGCSWVRLRRAA